MLGDMRPAQQRLAMQLVATGLSRPATSRCRRSWASRTCSTSSKGGPPVRARARARPGACTTSASSATRRRPAWSWRFGGHHVSIHHTVVDGAVVASTPCFLGADPACVAAARARTRCGRSPAPRTSRRELVRSLDDAQREPASCRRVAPIDLVGGNRHAHRRRRRAASAGRHLATPVRRRARRAHGADPGTGRARRSGCDPSTSTRSASPSTPKGISASTLRPTQQELLRRRARRLRGPDPRRARGGRGGQVRRRTARTPSSFAWAGGYRRRRAALLPDPGTAAAGRVRQHPARRQPRPLRVAGSGRRLRRRRPQPRTTGRPTDPQRSKAANRAGLSWSTAFRTRWSSDASPLSASASAPGYTQSKCG